MATSFNPNITSPTPPSGSGEWARFTASGTDTNRHITLNFGSDVDKVYAHQIIRVATTTVADTESFKTLQILDTNASTVSYVGIKNDNGIHKFQAHFYDENVASHYKSTITSNVVVGSDYIIETFYNSTTASYEFKIGGSSVEVGNVVGTTITPRQIRTGIVDVPSGKTVAIFIDDIKANDSGWIASVYENLISTINTTLNNTSNIRITKNFITNLVPSLEVDDNLSIVLGLSSELKPQLNSSTNFSYIADLSSNLENQLNSSTNLSYVAALSSDIGLQLNITNLISSHQNLNCSITPTLLLKAICRTLKPCSVALSSILSISGDTSVVKDMASNVAARLWVVGPGPWVTDTWKGTDDDSWKSFTNDFWISGIPLPILSVLTSLAATVQSSLSIISQPIGSYSNMSSKIIAQLIVQDAIARIQTSLSSTVAPQLLLNNTLHYLAGFTSTVGAVLNLSGTTSDLKGMSSELSTYLSFDSHLAGNVSMSTSILANLIVQDAIARIQTSLSSNVESILNTTSDLKKALNLSSGIEAQLNLSNDIKRLAGLVSTVEPQVSVSSNLIYIAALSSTINAILSTEMSGTGGNYVGLASHIKPELNRRLVNFNTFLSPEDINLALEIAMQLLIFSDLSVTAGVAADFGYKDDGDFNFKDDGGFSWKDN